MKNSIILCLLFVTSISFGQIGIGAGYSSGKAKISGGGTSVNSESSGAFAFGLVYDIELSDNFDLQPTLSFGMGEKVEGESNNAIGVGVNLQYYVSGKEKGFFIAPGLGLGYSLADVDTDFIKKTSFSGAIGLGYDFSKSFTLTASYATQLSNSAGDSLDGVKIKGSSIGAALQYYF